MMEKYLISIIQKEEYVKNVYIEANSTAEAKEKVEEKYDDEDIAMLKHSFNGMEKTYQVIKKVNNGRNRKDNRKK